MVPVPFAPRGRNRAVRQAKENDHDRYDNTKADLIQFTGSEHWYRHAMVRDILPIRLPRIAPRREPDVPLQLLRALFGIVTKPKDNHLASAAHQVAGPPGVGNVPVG